MPINKIDKENRLVSGFATLDNVDTSDDVVTAEASKGAFAAFRGNIREMHQPIAAGRLVDFREEEFFHNGEFFRGIYATAYVSKGAQDTWEKVLDGTLSGFSIGGNITDQESKFVKDAGPNGKVLRFIKAYDLVELSLVDNPANQLANVDGVVKVVGFEQDHGHMVMKGMVAETSIVNVFWCQTDEIAKNSTEASETCLSCGNAMEQIGWFEKGEDQVVKTATAVANFLRQKEGTVKTDIGEGGVTMADEVKKDAEVEDKDKAPAVQAGESAEGSAGVVTSESAAADDEKVEEAPADGEDAEKAAEVDEAPVEPDFEKMFDDLKGSVKDTIEKHVKAVEDKVADATEAFEKKASEFEKGLSELKDELTAVKDSREDVAKRLDALEKVSAIKKSGEVESEPVTKSKKGLWSGTFFDGE
jgi:hypothetical protein